MNVSARFLCPVLVFCIACSVPRTTPGVTDDGVVGGVAATSARLDAVGSVGRRAADGSLGVLCTATLIAPRLVLTARHCKVGFGSPEFVLGADALRPRRIVKIVQGFDAPERVDGGILDRGSDVSVGVLAEPIEDVVPIPVADDHLTGQTIGKRVAIVGFGRRNSAGEAQAGLRRVGSVTVRALEGAPLRAIFPTQADLLSYVTSRVGKLRDGDASNLRALFDEVLVAGRQVYVGQAPGDAQSCPGDSGGPLIGKVAGRIVVLGVTSSSAKFGEGFECSVLGSTYSTLGPDVQAIIEQARVAIGTEPPARVDAQLDVAAPVELPQESAGCGDVSVSGRC